MSHYRNVLKCLGPASTGKTMFAEALAAPFRTGYVNNMILASGSNFAFSGNEMCSLIMMEEPQFVEPTGLEMLKPMAGNLCMVDSKNSTHKTLFPSPILVTTNRPEFVVNQAPEMAEAFRSRCITYRFRRKINEMPYRLTPEGLYRMLYLHNNYCFTDKEW